MDQIGRELVENFDTILDTIHDDILIADGSGRVIRLSPTFEEVYGLEKEKAIGRTVYELEKEGYFRPSIVAKVIETGKKVTMRQKNNRERDIVATATPIFDKQGRIKFIVSFSRDITEMLELQKQYSKLESEIEKYKAELDALRKGNGFAEGVAGRSPQLESILQTIQRVADFDANILFLGPSGVGKTMFAKIVHQSSWRKDGPFVDINCAAIPENLLESELFGYEKGSFTGAGAEGKVGLIELADGGTLLLDEISEMSLSLQAKLLKVIQDKTFVRVGGTQKIKVDFRLITASNRDLEKMSDEGNFRKDLFYRLNVVKIEIPPLAQRKDDIVPILQHFLHKMNSKYGLHKTFHPMACEALLSYSWPGNVRELENVVERACMTSEGEEILVKHLPAELLKIQNIPYDHSDLEVEEQGLEQAMADFEGKIVRQAYEKYKTTVGVAKALKISQPTAFRKIEKYRKE